TASIEMLKVAFPALIVPVPSVVLPFVNVTVPVAVEGATVAVNVTEAPYADGFAHEDSVTVVFVLCTPAIRSRDRIRSYRQRRDAEGCFPRTDRARSQRRASIRERHRTRCCRGCHRGRELHRGPICRWVRRRSKRDGRVGFVYHLD